MYRYINNYLFLPSVPVNESVWGLKSSSPAMDSAVTIYQDNQWMTNV